MIIRSMKKQKVV